GRTRKGNANYAEALYALNRRFSELAGGHMITDIGNPVAAAAYSGGLRDAQAPLALDTASRLIIYKIYDGAAMSKLDKLYHLLNHHLKNHGVLPHLRYQIRKDESLPLPQELAAHYSPETLDRQSDLMALVQQL